MNEERKRFEELQKHVLLKFEYGSAVYGTSTDLSDIDIFVVVDDVIDLSDAVNGQWEFTEGRFDYQFANEKRWIEMIQDHDIRWLECYSLDKKHILYGDVDKYMQYFTLDKWKMRQVCSAIASNSWAKAHKKMIIEKDYDLYRAQKSLFHSFRILMFAAQIGEFGKIVDFEEANHWWDEINSMGEVSWDKYKERFKPIENQLRSIMVTKCPKPEGYKAENQQKKKKA